MNRFVLNSGVALTEWFAQFNITVVIPAYNVEKEIAGVLDSIPAYVRHIVVVDDASSDDTAKLVKRKSLNDERIELLRHVTNQGVGGAMLTGFRKALDLESQIVVKLDGDGQMSSEDLPRLLMPLMLGEADYAKGNRFHHFQALRRMSLIRRMGNISLSFLTKAAVGYWHCFDPTNGFLAIQGRVLARIPLEKVHRCYFFETSMLSQLYLLGAVVCDVPMPARYGNESSNLSIVRVLRDFPRLLLTCLGRRILLKNFIYDFNMESVYLLCGVPMILTGMIFGGLKWIHYSSLGIAAPTGTVVISAMLIILGFQILLAAIGLDLEDVPRQPISRAPLDEEIPGRLARSATASSQTVRAV